jgi:hypothetical protein
MALLMLAATGVVMLATMMVVGEILLLPKVLLLPLLWKTMELVVGKWSFIIRSLFIQAGSVCKIINQMNA